MHLSAYGYDLRVYWGIAEGSRDGERGYDEEMAVYLVANLAGEIYKRARCHNALIYVREAVRERIEVIEEMLHEKRRVNGRKGRSSRRIKVGVGDNR
jgi:hypothetical protein